MTITFTAEDIKLVNMFEHVTGCTVKHVCMFKDMQTFVVGEGEMGKALGKKGENVQKLERLLNKKIKVVEYSTDVRKFVANLILPNKVQSIVQEDDLIILSSDDVKTKGLVIGAKAQNLRQYEVITQKFFPIREIRVV
ncbi:MAG: NusA-like transcription termination signal-binding factor [archaeon]